MTHDEIHLLIIDGLASTFQIERSRVTRSARLYDDLDLDSIDAVDIAAKLQAQTGIRLTPHNFKSVVTVGDLILALDAPLNSLQGDAIPVEHGAGTHLEAHAQGTHDQAIG